MKVIILAGGFGTRIADAAEMIPKPMVPIGGRPILWHIMNRYAKFGFKDFYLALGYKAEIIKEYFLNYRLLGSNFTVDLANGALTPIDSPSVDWRVTLVDTGLATMTGGRLRRMASYIAGEPFMLTYGDGLADIDLKALLAQHRKQGKEVTVTAVRPVARFGELSLSGTLVSEFREKPQVNAGWINGGFFVCENRFLDRIANDETMLEQEPLEGAAKQGQLNAYCHDGFWQCMDTKRDKDLLEQIWVEGRAPWL
jgi:glucose-1-phosphate cytidylyltransferase